MAIAIKSKADIQKMRAAGKLAAKVLNYAETLIKPGISTLEINDKCHEFTIKNGAISAPLNYKGFPKSLCASVNDMVCHGVPSERVILQDGDIVNIDVTVIKDGYHGDTSRTFLVGNVSEDTKLLVERTYKAMMKGIETIKPNVFLEEIGANIEKYIEKFNYGIVKDYTGHGIGKVFHEEPHVFHHDTGTRSIRLKEGMIFTVEPMINASPNSDVILDEEDHWTVYTADGALSAQFEHTVLVTGSGFEILTKF